MLRHTLIALLALAHLCVARNCVAASATGVWSSKFPTPPGADGPIYAMTTYRSNLVVAGSFTKLAGTHARGLAMWNGQAWSEFGGGIVTSNSATVYALASDGDNLFIGGSFTNVGGIISSNVARWNGAQWDNLDGGVAGIQTRPSAVYAMHLQGSNLFVAGTFVKAGSVEALNVARWDGANWHALDRGAFMPTDLDEPWA